MTSSDLKYLYNLFNKKYFSDKLPDIYVHYGKTRRGCYGFTAFTTLCKRCEKCKRLKLKYGHEMKNGRLAIHLTVSNLLKKSLGVHQSVITLLHEMMHVSIGGKYKHGPKFRKEKKRLLRAGAYDRWL
jgi:hypothetical protein